LETTLVDQFLHTPNSSTWEATWVDQVSQKVTFHIHE
jgi:hypothetical protein